LAQLINQTVGDALSDLLLVEVILAHKPWGPKEWDLTYTDLPNRLVRVEVADRNIFKAVDAGNLKVRQGTSANRCIGRYIRTAEVSPERAGRRMRSGCMQRRPREEADDLAQKVAGIVKQAGV
jgi:phosphoacetylglucosamine mutase